jgi:hypothetical protein
MKTTTNRWMEPPQAAVNSSKVTDCKATSNALEDANVVAEVPGEKKRREHQGANKELSMRQQLDRTGAQIA